MIDSRIGAGIIDNVFSSQFASDKNYHSNDANLNIKGDLNDI